VDWIAAPFVLAIIGLFLGLTLNSQFVHWATLVATMVGKHGGDFLGPPRHRLIWGAPIIAVLHPGLLFQGIAIFLAVQSVRQGVSPSMRWLLLGYGISLIHLCIVGFVMYRFRGKPM
jgi:hypothetical protein